MLKRLDLTNFKGFERFTVSFKGQTILVGPNNAGKSTLIAALRAAEGAIRQARARKATERVVVDDIGRVGFRLSADQLTLVDENLRYEYRDDRPTLVKVTFKNGCVLEIRWEPGEDPSAFAFLVADEQNLTAPSQVRPLVEPIGIVPVLSPLVPREKILERETIDASVQTPRASRHTRNHLYRLSQDPSEIAGNRFEEFREFAAEWITELELGKVRGDLQADSIDVEYRDPGSRFPKEISWAGDGMQVWVQLLLHLFRLRDSATVVLDEPDLFLHADMQRRLVGALETLTGQMVTATHSPEVLAEARQDAVVWVSRDRRHGKRAPGPDLQHKLSQALGTSFNLRLARALRAHTVVFVEGKDMKLLRNLARRLSATNVQNEVGIAVIPLEGFDRWEHVEPFKWMVSKFLEDSVEVRVALDRDYRGEGPVQDVLARLEGVGVSGHVWGMHELESYLVHPEAIARAAGAPLGVVDEAIDEALVGLRDEVAAGVERADLDWMRGKEDPRTTRRAARKRFSEAWGAGRDARIAISPGKELISAISDLVQARGPRRQGISPRLLSHKLQVREMADDLIGFIRALDESTGNHPP